MTVIINGTDNSASTPAVTGTDGDTGMFYPAANTVALSTGGSERMRITSGGAVSIGTTSTYGTNSKLNIQGSTTAADTALVISDGATATLGLALATPSSATIPYIFSNIALALGTNGAERMRIDTSGRVTMPYQPIFAAKKNTNQNCSGGTTVDVTFGAAIVNIGSHYNTTTSKFTAPIAGTYFFSFQISAAFNSASYISLVPLKNGSGLGNYAAFSSSTTNGGYTVLSTSFIITLAANDYINCQFEHNNNPTLDNAGMFCGYLIG